MADDELMKSDPALSGGPYMAVALHTIDQSRIPLNVTSLVNEWALHLDPIAEITAAPEVWFTKQPWIARGHFAMPDWYTIEVLRNAARNPKLIEKFRKSTLSLKLPTLGTRWTAKLTHMVREEGGALHLERGAMPVLLGLAVYAAIRVPVGLKGQEVALRLQEYWDDWKDERPSRRHGF